MYNKQIEYIEKPKRLFFQAENGKYYLFGEKFHTCQGPKTFGTYMWAEFDNLPKVENASIIQPNYASGTSVKTSDSSDYNIYNTIPDIMSNIKEEVKPAEVEDSEFLYRVHNKYNP